jgi:hypothetical protein
LEDAALKAEQRRAWDVAAEFWTRAARIAVAQSVKARCYALAITARVEHSKSRVAA